MKFGIRKPSIKKRIAARTSPKRYVRHTLGFKAPRGMGWLTNPKKAAYNRVYNRTTVSVDKLFSGSSRNKGGEAIIFLVIFGVLIFAIKLIFLVLVWVYKLLTGQHTNSEEIPYLDKQIIDAKEDDGPNSNIDHNALDLPAEFVELPSCPRCSQPMVKRVARRGKNTGNSFWGCSKFPKCRGTRAA